MSWWRRSRPVRDDRWLSRLLGAARKHRALRTIDDFAWAADYIADRLGCACDFEVTGPGRLLFTLSVECPTLEVDAAWIALRDYAPSSVCVIVVRAGAAEGAA